MGFYYFSILSLAPLAIAYGLLLLVFWGIAHLTRRMPGRKALLAAIGAVFLILPVSEELWIAWNFGQACKEAGTFIQQKVQVEGFYDGTRTTHANTPTPQAIESFEKSGYRFFEMRGQEKFVRIEKIDGQWKPIVLDRPTARYHFRFSDPTDGTPWAHKIVRSGSVVMDSESNKEIARYTSFGRRPAWFFIGLGTSAFACYAPGRWPLTRGSRLIYPEVLIPAVQR